MENEVFCVLDIETTGLSCRRHGITEFSAIKIKKNKQSFDILDEFSTLINPGQHIPSFITRLTGIDDEMVKDAPTFDKIGPQIHDFIGNSTIVAHNATFDFRFIDYYLSEQLQRKLTNPTLCTRKLSRRILPGIGSYKLSTLCEYLDIEQKEAHRAMADVLVTKEVFTHLTNKLETHNIKTLPEVFDLQKKSPSQLARMFTSTDIL